MDRMASNRRKGINISNNKEQWCQLLQSCRAAEWRCWPCACQSLYTFHVVWISRNGNRKSISGKIGRKHGSCTAGVFGKSQ